VLGGPHFSCHQVPEIPLWICDDGIHVFEKPPDSLSLEQPNLNAKQLSTDSIVMGRSPDKWPMFLGAYPVVQCLASATSSCFSAAQVNVLADLCKEITTQLNQTICYVDGACLC